LEGIPSEQIGGIDVIKSPNAANTEGGLGGITKADAALFRKTAAKMGVVGAVEVEASPWIEDNLWVLLELEKDPIMVGTIGNLEPDKPEFREYLERYHRNPLFLGLRYGNIWGRSLVGMVDKPEFIAGMKVLAAANLTFDTANPRVDLLRSVITLTDKVPDLRVVMDHVPGMTAFDEPGTRERVLREGAFAYLPKPVSLTWLHKVIESALSGPTA
jgi:predicted TIM-barrel fold metal-dependent hydrolase